MPPKANAPSQRTAARAYIQPFAAMTNENRHDEICSHQGNFHPISIPPTVFQQKRGSQFFVINKRGGAILFLTNPRHSRKPGSGCFFCWRQGCTYSDFQGQRCPPDQTDHKRAWRPIRTGSRCHGRPGVADEHGCRYG